MGAQAPRVQFFYIFFIKLNKNNKNINNGDCILAKKTILPPKNKKKSCVIGEVKAKFFATIVNWYKCQLSVVSC